MILRLVSIFCMGMFGVQCVFAQDEPWKFEIAPYLWAINMNGSVGIGPRQTHISESFSDLIKYFKGGGMLWLSANKDKFGLFANAVYADLSKNTNVDTLIGPYTIRSTNKYGVYTLGASYAVYQQRNKNCSLFSVEPYIGLRYTHNSASLKILNTAISFSDNQGWTDPLIGMRLRYNMQGWRFMLAGDVGGTNFNDHNSINLNGLIGYNPCAAKWFTFYVGYKYLYQKYITGSGNDYFAWNMRLFGPLVGFSIGF